MVQLITNDSFLQDIQDAIDGTDCAKLADVKALVQSKLDSLNDEIGYINANHSGDTYFELLKMRAQEEKTFWQFAKNGISARQTALGC